ncbi:DUF2140 family protein [Bacillus sp. FJAT-44742]|uniref:DUF2140 family protein n=1 Tax=Bacillus sp. FJAT-44742 TaxID=2014005 RepID=UPI000C24FFA3|nr:hypothetical protein [Bacillus sp. FJAT-44742]
MKGTKALLIIIGGIIVSVLIFFFLIRPVEQLQPPVSSNEENGFLQQGPDSVNVDLENRAIELAFEVNEEDINAAAQESIEDDQDIEELEIQVNEERVTVYANSSLFPFIATQYRLFFIPGIENGQLILALEEAYMGRIPLPNQFVLNQIEMEEDYFYLDSDRERIILFPDLPENVTFSAVELSQGEIKTELVITIESLSDAIQLIEEILPQGVEEEILNRLF